MSKSQTSKVKPPTAAERLAQDCPRCGAMAGEPCQDYKGHARLDSGQHRAPTADDPLCQERGRPDITAKKLQKKADELNAKARAAYGPLFQFVADEEVKPITPADLAAKKLHERRLGVEDGGLAEWACRRGLNWIAMWHVRRVASELMGADWEARLWERCERVYHDKLEYILGNYRKALCTAETIPLEYARHVDKVEPSQWNPSGERIRIEVVSAWPPVGWVPVMTDAEFSARFQLLGVFWTAPKDLPEHDDGGLFDRVMARVALVV